MGAGDTKRAQVVADWSAQPLGICTDMEIAKRLGVSRSYVCAKRLEMGIKCSVRSVAANRGADAMIRDGLSAKEIAEKTGCSTTAIYARMTALGIRSVGYKGCVDWDAEQVLGTTFDVVIAERYGVTKETVAAARTRRGIQVYKEVRVCVCGNTFVAHSRHKKYCSKVRGYGCAHQAVFARNGGREGELVDLYVVRHALNLDLKKRGAR